MKLYVAWCASHKVVVRQLHTDNAGELSGAAVKDLATGLASPIQITICAAHVARGNGVMKRRWRIMGND